MRWERLFDELEGQIEHQHLLERDALVAELREGEWAQVSWTQVLVEGAGVEVHVRDVGPVRGTVTFANSHVIGIRSTTAEHAVSVRAVVSVSAGGRPGASPPLVDALGWAHLLRSAEDGFLRFVLAGGLSVDGRVDVVGRDFVRVRTEIGTVRLVPFDAIRMMTVLAG